MATWGTGETCEKSGLYLCECWRKHRGPRKAHLERGELFPPCNSPGCGEIVQWKLLAELPPETGNGDH